MPISGCHDLPLATFNLPSRKRPQNKRQQRPSQLSSRPEPEKFNANVARLCYNFPKCFG